MKNKFQKNIDKSGKMFRLNYLEKYYKDILDEILKFSNENKLENLPFKQKVYHWYHNIDHIMKCYCGNNLKFKNSSIGYYKFCSKKCMNNSSEIKQKRKETNLKKFGTKTPSENLKIKNKIISTNNKKYFSNSPMQNNKILNKSKNTLYKNYGVLSPLKSNIIKDKMIQTNLEKYGVENVKQNKEINNKINNTMIKKYGVKYALQNKEIKNKVIKKLKENISKKIIKYYPEYDILNIDFDKKEYTIKCEQGHIFKINYVLLNSRRRSNTVICTICNPIDKSISGLQMQLINFIKENYNDKIIENDRKIINKELDIYLPDLNLAFEFNGLYWHSELYKDKKYHLNKTEECLKKGIQLIHIWEDDWIYKQNIIKSMILNKIGKTSNKIFARKTKIKIITDNMIVRNFLDKNHIQGFVGSSIKIGLFYENELVSLMTFGKNRLGIGKIKKYDYELLRFCNKLNTNVIGGASKLFKYFINNYEVNKIVSYADRSYSNGKLYNILGFIKDHTTKESYYYIIDKIRKHRFNYRKSKLKGDGSEHKQMQEKDIYRIYNSGHICFIWNR